MMVGDEEDNDVEEMNRDGMLRLVNVVTTEPSLSQPRGVESDLGRNQNLGEDPPPPLGDFGLARKRSFSLCFCMIVTRSSSSSRSSMDI